jgi:hypothetical protein
LEFEAHATFEELTPAGKLTISGTNPYGRTYFIRAVARSENGSVKFDTADEWNPTVPVHPMGGAVSSKSANLARKHDVQDNIVVEWHILNTLRGERSAELVPDEIVFATSSA